MAKALTIDDTKRFLHALYSMALVFSDEMTLDRQRLYWETCRDEVSIDEWEYACKRAIKQETFHKVPRPAVLLRYVTEWRAEKRRRTEAERDQPMTREQLVQLREELVSPEEVHALIASIWPFGQTPTPASQARET